MREVEDEFPAKFRIPERSVELTNLYLDLQFLKGFNFFNDEKEQDPRLRKPMYVHVVKMALLAFFNILEKELQSGAFFEYFEVNNELGRLTEFIENMRGLIDREVSGEVGPREFHIIRLLKLDFAE